MVATTGSSAPTSRAVATTPDAPPAMEAKLAVTAETPGW